MGDFSAVCTILHHQHFQFGHIVDQELFEAGWQHVLGAVVRSITDVWHQVLALELTANAIVNTLRFTPFDLKLEEINEIESLLEVNSIRYNGRELMIIAVKYFNLLSMVRWKLCVDTAKSKVMLIEQIKTHTESLA